MVQQKILGLRVLCNGERTPAPFLVQELTADDPIFTTGQLSPLSELLEIPILIRKDPTPASSLFERADLDNQPITYLMIESDSGLAPPEWQMNIGSVIIARQDKKPLTEQHFECLWDFISNVILEAFGDGDDDSATAAMSRVRFNQFWEDYRQSKLLDEFYGGQERYANVVNPYQI